MILRSAPSWARDPTFLVRLAVSSVAIGFDAMKFLVAVVRIVNGILRACPTPNSKTNPHVARGRISNLPVPQEVPLRCRQRSEVGDFHPVAVDDLDLPVDDLTCRAGGQAVHCGSA
jgi:hypothetical protein